MPGIKKDFSGGKMNKDLDERILPGGQYRDAMNIQVRTTSSESGSTNAAGGAGNGGAVQNIKGNLRLTEKAYFETSYLGTSINESKFIASYANEKNNKSYWFLASPNMETMLDQIAGNNVAVSGEGNGRKLFIDSIIEVEVKPSEHISAPVVVDYWGGIFSPKLIIKPSLLNEYWNAGSTFDIPIANGAKDYYRPGMIIEVYDDQDQIILYNSDGTGAPEIQSVSDDNITVYNSLEEIDWSYAEYVVLKAPRVLNFDANRVVTGVNIIDDLLFWTDNQTPTSTSPHIGEPKKINIERCKEGSKANENLDSWIKHTQLKLKDPNDSDLLLDFVDPNQNTLGVPEQPLSSAVTNDLKPDHVTVIRKAPLMAPTIHMRRSDRDGSTDVDEIIIDLASWDNPGQEEIDNIALGTTFTLPTEADLSGVEANVVNDPEIFNFKDYEVNDILVLQELTWDTESWLTVVIDDITWTGDDPSTTATEEDGYKVLTLRVLSINKTLTPVEIDPATDEPTVQGQGTWSISLQQRDPLFELKFGRFSTRYRYADGEYSNFGPWSEIAFLPGNFDFDHKRGYNLGMANSVRSLIIKDFIPHQRVRSEDMVSVDLLYKTTESPNVYIVKTITKGRDPEWDQYVINDETNDLAFGQMNITSEMIYKTIANNQTLRAWDNVPRAALSQEIAANRLVYGNYTQGYEIINKPGLKQNLKNYHTPSPTWPEKSMKSIRDYKVGMVFGDKYGRETPVISPGYLDEKHPMSGRFEIVDGNIRVPKIFSSYKNTIELQQLWGDNNEGEPDGWIDYVKYYIKETSNEYYNVVMDRWYDAEDGNVWISFASADRNKIDEDTYLILKNKHGENEAVTEKARYKVISIENEAPDFIKRKSKSMGEIDLGTMSSTNSDTYPSWEHAQDMFGDAMNPLGASPIELMNATEMRISPDAWNGFLDSYSMVGSDSDLEFRIKASSSGQVVAGQTWRMITYFNVIDCGDDPEEECEDDGLAGIRWDKAFEEQADMFDLLVQAVGVNPLPDITYFLEFREMAVDNKPEFDGKFFVKLEKDDMLMAKVLNMTGIQTGYNIIDSFPVAYIDNQEYNPSDMESQYANSTYMPRRNYKWMNQSGESAWNPLNYGDGDNDIEALYGYEEEYTWTDGSGDVETVPTNAAWSNSGGSENVSEANVADTQASHLSGGELIGSNVFGGGNSMFPGNSASLKCGNSSSKGCHPYDAEFMALGCWGTEDTASSGYGEDNMGSLIYNRTLETHRWWEWLMNIAQSDNAAWGGTNTKIWIDGMRTAALSYNGQTPLVYEKPTGLDAGIATSDGSSSATFNPTGAQLGRMSIGFQGTEWPGDAESPEYKFKQHITSYGTLFKFLKDPEDTVYMVVSSTTGTNAVDEYSAFNHNQTGWGCADEAESDGSEQIDFTNRNPIHADGYLGVSWEDGVSGWITAGSGCELCGSCASVIDNPLGGYGTCYRVGVRIEFRRYDTQGGGLANSEDGIGDLGVDTAVWDPRGAICHDGREAMRIAIMQSETSGGEVVIPTRDPAIWETEPKEDVGMDIYYEASNALPKKLTQENTANFAPYNSRVKCRAFVGGGYTYDFAQTGMNNIENGAPQFVLDIGLDGEPDDETVGVIESGIVKGLYVKYIGYTKTNSIVGLGATQVTLAAPTTPKDGWLESSSVTDGVSTGEIDANTDNLFFTFEHPDGTITMSKVLGHMKPVNSDGSDMVYDSTADEWLVSAGGDIGVTTTKEALFKPSSTQTGFFRLDNDVWKYPVELSWHNCWAFGNGVESDRIRDDFNANQVDNGVKVSSVLLDYGRERRGSGMIYSGIYNSTSGTNKLNEFNMAEKITKDINPSYGTIQRLKTRDTDMVVLTEDKILKVTTNKDALYNADGNPQLLASNRVLGTAVPFSGDYGISQNPESLSWDQFRLYFTDMQRGAVLRLSRDGLTPISNVGLKSWFRDALPEARKLIGTFDTVNGEYNLSIFKSASTVTSATTVSFSEESKGWVSFKSFVPQTGISISGQYITAVADRLHDVAKRRVGVYRHHEDITDLMGNVMNRNTFYAGYAPYDNEDVNYDYYYRDSSIHVTFNDMPDVVKNFTAVNYEGSQARIDRFATSNNSSSGMGDGEYINLRAEKGWWIDSIRTDRTFKYSDVSSSGSVSNFVDKEGKWFQHIRGTRRSPLNAGTTLLDFYIKEFSLQGIGETQTYTPPDPEDLTLEEQVVGCMDEVANNYNENATIACEDCCDYSVTIQGTSDFINDPSD